MENAKEYLSVKDFAQKIGVSVQSVYKKINKEDSELKPYIVKEKNVVKIDIRAITEIYNIPVKTASPKEETVDIKEFFINQLQEKDRQIQEKDRQIQEKDNQLNSALERLAEANRLLDQQQKLNAADKSKILELESQEQKRKRGLFGFFRKNN